MSRTYKRISGSLTNCSIMAVFQTKTLSLISTTDVFKIFQSLKLQLHDAIYRLRFYSNSSIHILSLSNSHNNVASIQKNRGNKSQRVIVALVTSYLPSCWKIFASFVLFRRCSEEMHHYNPISLLLCCGDVIPPIIPPSSFYNITSYISKCRSLINFKNI